MHYLLLLDGYVIEKAIEASCGTDCKYDDEETAYKLIKSTIEGCLLVFTFVCVLCGLDRI